MFYAQKAGVVWLRLGDANTIFFHTKAKEKRAVAAIYCLISNDHRRLLTPNGIRDEFLRYFQNLLAVPGMSEGISEYIVRLGRWFLQTLMAR